MCAVDPNELPMFNRQIPSETFVLRWHDSATSQNSPQRRPLGIAAFATVECGVWPRFNIGEVEFMLNAGSGPILYCTILC
jgi:hypothetical protein